MYILDSGPLSTARDQDMPLSDVAERTTGMISNKTSRITDTKGRNSTAERRAVLR